MCVRSVCDVLGLFFGGGLRGSSVVRLSVLIEDGVLVETIGKGFRGEI